MISFGLSRVFYAFEEEGVVGSKVISGSADIQMVLAKEIERNGLPKGKDPFICLPMELHGLVRCGVAPIENLGPQDLHIKMYRGEPIMCALPSRAMKKYDTLRCLVMEIDRYLNNPQVTPAEHKDLRAEDPTHVIVALHAGPGAMSSHRLVRNIAGGSSDYEPYSALNKGEELIVAGGSEQIGLSPGEQAGDVLLVHKIIKDAKETAKQEQTYITVADVDIGALTETQEDDY